MADEVLQQFPMVTRKDDVVIAYRMSQEIVGLIFIGELYYLLGATKIGLGLTSHKFSFSNKTTREVARDLEDGDRSFLHIPSDTHTDTRFEVGV